MTPAEQAAKLETMLKDFEKAHPDSGKNLRDLLAKSPELNTRVLKAIDANNLEKFEALSADERSRGAIGSYSPSRNSIKLPTDLLDIADKDPIAANRVLITVGHEIEHSVNKKDVETSRTDFIAAVTKIAEGPSPHDYTGVVKARNESMRAREANDEMAGVNVLAAKVRRDNPKATLEDLYLASPRDMRAYIKQDLGHSPPTYTARGGLSFDADLKLSGAKNQEEMGKLFYDGLGYPAHYGARNLAVVGQIEDAARAAAKAKDPAGYKEPEAKIDLKAAGLGSVPAGSLPANLKDSSLPRLDPSPAPPGGAGAPDAPLYRQAAAALEKLGPDASGIRNPEELRAVAAAMAVNARNDGLTSIDAVVRSNNSNQLIAVQGDVRNPAAALSAIDKDKAAGQNPEQNLAALQTGPAQAQAEQSQKQQQSAPAR